MYLDGFTQITNIDYSPVVIENMRNKTAETDMKWLVMDITNMEFESEKFDVIIEKATLDALLVNERDPWHMSDSGGILMDRILSQVCYWIYMILISLMWFFDHQVSGLLSNEGRFISITFAQPHFRKRIYGCEAYKWSVDVESFGNGFHFFFYVMTKGRILALDDCYVRQCQLAQQPVTFLEDEDHDNFLNSIETWNSFISVSVWDHNITSMFWINTFEWFYLQDFIGQIRKIDNDSVYILYASW